MGLLGNQINYPVRFQDLKTRLENHVCLFVCKVSFEIEDHVCLFVCSRYKCVGLLTETFRRPNNDQKIFVIMF